MGLWGCWHHDPARETVTMNPIDVDSTRSNISRLGSHVGSRPNSSFAVPVPDTNTALEHREPVWSVAPF